MTKETKANTYEHAHDKINIIACAPSEDWGQSGQLPRAVRLKKTWILSYLLGAQRRLWSDLADAQADLSLRYAHISICCFCHEVTLIIVKLV